MATYSVGDVAAHLTHLSGEYFATHRVANALRRLVETGRLPERRAGRARVVFDSELPIIEEALGIVRVKSFRSPIDQSGDVK